MKLPVLVVVAAAAFVGCGSGTTPVSYCNALENEVCVRVFDCTTPPPPDPSLYGASVADCQAMLRAQNCATSSNSEPCPSGQSFHADKADACVADIKAESCGDFNSGFTSGNCLSVCS